MTMTNKDCPRCSSRLFFDEFRKERWLWCLNCGYERVLSCIDYGGIERGYLDLVRIVFHGKKRKVKV